LTAKRSYAMIILLFFVDKGAPMNATSLPAGHRRRLTMLALGRAKEKLRKVVEMDADLYSEHELKDFQDMLAYVSEQHKLMQKNPDLQTVSIRSICNSIPISNALAKCDIRDVIDILHFRSFEVRKMIGRSGRQAIRFTIVSLLYDHQPRKRPTRGVNHETEGSTGSSTPGKPPEDV
jgi:hypothetical protein